MRTGRTRTVLVAVAVLVAPVSMGGSITVAQEGSPGVSAPPVADDGAFNPEPCAAIGGPGDGGGPAGVRGRALALMGAAPALDPYSCPLAAWDPGAAWELPGTIDLAAAFHHPDPPGDSPDPQGDIVDVAWAPLRLTARQARRVARTGGLVTRGRAEDAIRAGNHLLVQVQTVEQPVIRQGAILSIHVGTDRNGDPGDNVPASVANPVGPWVDVQDVYSVFLVDGRGAPNAYTTDFAGPRDANGSPWYNGDTAFAARVIADPPGVQFLLPARAVGASLRPVTLTRPAAAAGSPVSIASVRGLDTPGAGPFQQGTFIPDGSDFGRIGTRLGLFPRDGYARVLVGCLEADTIHEPMVLPQLSIDGQVELNATMLSQTPIIFSLWPTFEDGDELRSWFNFADADGDGVTIVPVTLVVKEAWWDAEAGRSVSQEQRQTGQARITLRGGTLHVGVVAGLRHHGYHDLMGVEFESTGNERVDDILAASAADAVAILPAWSVDEQVGWTAGDDACLPGGVREVLGGPPR